MSRSVVVVRDGGKCENVRPLTDRERRRLRRDIVYARRGLRRYGLRWINSTNPLTGVRGWKLVMDGVVAVVRDAGLMSFSSVEVAGETVRHRYKEEEFAGVGGVEICVLRTTQHVLALIEERAAAAEGALAADVSR